MPRSISVVRRKANLVDLTVRRRPSVVGFRFSSASNFDAAFTAFQTVPNDGLIRCGEALLPRFEMWAGGAFPKDQCRFLFDPSFYTPTRSEIRDDKPWFIRLEPQNADGTFGAAEAMHMILPAGSQPHRTIQLQGTVPSGADLTASIEIQLPMQCNDWEIQNDGAANMAIAFERGAVAGPEFRLDPMSSIFRSLQYTITSVSQVFMRGIGGSTTISAIFTARNDLGV